MLNWRYVDHPQSGGAEVVTHQILRRLVADGHEVTCFTAAYEGAGPTGEIDGVRLLRRGGQATVHLHAWRWLRRRTGSFDRVVDQVNTIPFLTPLYVRSPRPQLFIHQLAREYWFRETRGAFKLVAPFGYLAEPAYLQPYRRTPVVTVSPSTRDDLRRLGIGRHGITVLRQAIPYAPLPELDVKRPGAPRLVVLGRLTPAKFVEEALDAFLLARERLPGATLDVIGEGDPAYREHLERRAEAAGGGVTFHGRVETERKLELLRDAHAHIFCSHREGWGLTVTEAYAMGTPTVGFDAPGVRDSVADERLLAPIGDVDALADRLVGLLRDDALYAAVRESGWRDTLDRTYERATSDFAAGISVAYRSAASTPPPPRSGCPGTPA